MKVLCNVHGHPPIKKPHHESKNGPPHREKGSKEALT